ncbi:chemotaxis protein CheB [Burkholderia sp. PAMC 28687]|uniref:chemotaxis protein CheB n=1 Tax=Burkholderia sp. PAMC 28687 TaxID=1795874 RepID=UPI003FA4C6F0
MPASIVRQASLSRPRSKRKPLSNAGPAARSDELFVVGIGASAGGLDACRKLVEALPPRTATAWIFVQHLDPAHESLLVSLLTGHTRMTVMQAADGMLVEPEHLYIIAPGTYYPSPTECYAVPFHKHVTARGCPLTSCCIHSRKSMAHRLRALSCREPARMEVSA